MPKEFVLDEWVAEITEGVDLEDSEVEGLKKVLADDTVQTKLKASVLRQSDYSRQMDDLTTTKADLEKQVADTTAFLTSNQDRDHNNQEKYDTLLAERDEFEKRLLEVDEDFNKVEKPKVPAIDTSKFVTEEKVTELVENLADKYGAGLLKYSTKIVKLSNQYFRDTGKELDPEELVEIASKGSIDIETAYTQMTHEDYAVIDKQTREDEIKKEVESRLAEELSKRDMPLLDSGPKRLHPFTDKTPSDTKSTEVSRVGAAVSGLRRIKSGADQIPAWITD